MKSPLLALFLLLLLTACAFSAPEPTPDIPATVTAQVQAQLASIPTAVPPPTARPTPYPTQTQVPRRPTATPYPTPTPTPTPAPTASIAITMEEVKAGVVRIETLDGSGAGVIFETTTQGALVVTNYHVIAGSSQVEVVVAGETYQSKLLGYDAHKDLAVLEICCGQFQALVIRDAKDVAKPGTEVLAIGYALGLDGEASVTRGIVSKLRYNAKHSGWVIQTDAPINSGNSGGPLLLSSGEVIGINSYIFYEDAGRVLTEGVGFALAGQTVNGALDELKSGTKIALPTPTPTPTATPWPTLTPPQVVSSWKMYNNASHRYSFNYPEDWQIEVKDGGRLVYARSPDGNVTVFVFVPDYPIASAENRLEQFVDEWGPDNYFFEVLEKSPYNRGTMGGAYLKYRAQYVTELCTSISENFLMTRGTGKYWWIQTDVCEDFERHHRLTLSVIVGSLVFHP